MRDFLEQHAVWLHAHHQAMLGKGYNYTSIYDYVLDRGMSFASEPLTIDELCYVEQTIQRSGCRCVMKACFGNSQRILMSDHANRLRYVEGFVSCVIPIHHGWLTINDKVVDVTLRHDHPRGEYVLGELPEGREYIGVAFDKAQVRESILETEEYRSLIDDWQRGFPCFKETRRTPTPSTNILQFPISAS